MLLLSLFLLSFQGPIQADESTKGELEKADNVFRTIPAGNQIQHDPFEIVVPEGSLYVPAENVQMMYRLMNTDSIPGCVGMFISASNQWDFAISVQYLNKEVRLKPELPPEAWEELLLTKHILTRNESNQVGELHLPPQYDPSEGTFTVGVKYTDENDQTVSYIRKVWGAPKGGMVLTLRATNNSEDYDAELISNIFASVQVVDRERLGGMNYAVSYLGLMGITRLNENPPVPIDLPEQVQVIEEGVSPMTILMSVLLVLFATTLLLTASRLKAKQKESEESTT